MPKYVSRRQDKHGAHRGFVPGDRRQIAILADAAHLYTAYVGGIKLRGQYRTLENAERAALLWMQNHPSLGSDGAVDLQKLSAKTLADSAP